MGGAWDVFERVVNLPNPKAKLPLSWYSKTPSSKQHKYECSITRTSTPTNESGHQQSTHATTLAGSASDFMVNFVKFSVTTKFGGFHRSVVVFSRVWLCKLFSEYNQQCFSNLFISVRRSTCFRRFFRPSSGAQNCTYSARHLSDRYCYLLLAWMR